MQWQKCVTGVLYIPYILIFIMRINLKFFSLVSVIFILITVNKMQFYCAIFNLKNWLCIMSVFFHAIFLVNHFPNILQKYQPTIGNFRKTKTGPSP